MKEEDEKVRLLVGVGVEARVIGSSRSRSFRRSKRARVAPTARVTRGDPPARSHAKRVPTACFFRLVFRFPTLGLGEPGRAWRASLDLPRMPRPFPNIPPSLPPPLPQTDPNQPTIGGGYNLLKRIRKVYAADERPYHAFLAILIRFRNADFTTEQVRILSLNSTRNDLTWTNNTSVTPTWSWSASRTSPYLPPHLSLPPLQTRGNAIQAESARTSKSAAWDPSTRLIDNVNRGSLVQTREFRDEALRWQRFPWRVLFWIFWGQVFWLFGDLAFSTASFIIALARDSGFITVNSSLSETSTSH